MTTTTTNRVPADRRYTDVHTWVAPAPHGRPGGERLRLGVTADATEGTCVVAVELPSTGSPIVAGELYALIVTSPLSITPVYAPVDGLVAAVNPVVRDDPGVVARDPLRAGWLIAVLPTTGYTTDELLTASEYEGLLDTRIPRMIPRNVNS